MTGITVKYRGVMADLTGKTAETVAALDVRDVVRYISKSYGAGAGKAAKAMLITLNGKSIARLKVYKTELKTGDTLEFFPICGGG